MQRNFTPQGKPQDPGAIDRQAHAVALADLQSLAPALSSLVERLGELNTLVTGAMRTAGQNRTTGELHALCRKAHNAVGLK